MKSSFSKEQEEKNNSMDKKKEREEKIFQKTFQKTSLLRILAKSLFEKGKSFNAFLGRGFVFLFLAVVSGFVLSYPLFFLATQNPKLFQSFILLLLFLSLGFFSIRRFIKQFKKEVRELRESIKEKLEKEPKKESEKKSKGEFPKNQWLRAWIHSVSFLFPSWLSTWSFWVFWIGGNLLLLLLFSSVFFYLLFTFFDVAFVPYRFFIRVDLFLWRVIANNWMFFLGIFLPLFFLLNLFHSKKLLRRKSRFFLIYLVYLSFQLPLLYLSLYVFLLYILIFA